MLHQLASVALGVLTALHSFFAGPQAQPPQFGVALPTGTAVFETTLQSRISTSDTSMTLTANSIRGGTSLSGYNCFTVDEGRSDAEYICGQVSGTSVTALERGIDPNTGTSTIAALQFAHRVGADVKITDFPLIQRLRNQNNGVETFPNLLTYDTRVLVGNSSATSTLATKYYVDNTAIAGAPNSSETVNGISQLATAGQAAAGTSAGSTGARLTLPASLATSTCQSAANSVLVASSTTGKLDGRCLDTASNAYTWSQPQTFLGTTTMATSTVASSSVTTLNVKTLNFTTLNGTIAIPHYTVTESSFTVTAGYATSTNQIVIPANTLTASSTFSLLVVGQCAHGTSVGTCTFDIKNTTGATLMTCTDGQTSTSQTYQNQFFIQGNNYSLSSQQFTGTRISGQQNAGSASTVFLSNCGGSASINFSQAQTLVAVLEAPIAQMTPTYSYTFTVNP